MSIREGHGTDQPDDMSPSCHTKPSNYSVHEVEKVVDREKKKIEMCIGQFFTSGYNIWTQQQIEKSICFDSKLLGRKIQLVIEKEGEFVVNTSDINNRDRATCLSMSQILSIIVKKAMSETGLIQLGRHPRFFDHTDPTVLRDMDIQIWKGFKCSAYKYADSCSLIIDDCCRFMSTKSVMTRMDEIYD